ncbi:MAG: mechanosensitive ion channel family protein [Bacteroidetes bacterium]|nr:mechanosensitive ion channel family protein [Bacteroidota bacterium]MCL2302789.1 mechanosensitive ion channel family protein [Lentimicrobiaceae bacterium]
MFHWISEAIHLFFLQLGLKGQFLHFTSAVVTAILLLSAGFILYYIIRIILQNSIRITNKRFPSKWRTALLKERFFIQLSFLLPVIIIKHLIPEFFENGTKSEAIFIVFINLYLVTNVTLILTAFIKAVGELLLQSEATKDKPIKSYIQIISIFFWVISIVLFISILINKSPTVFLAGLGAFSAVLMLIFQDTIVGFVNSMQLATNDLIRNGDWITVDRYNVDGTVEEINLVSVKVRNFDGTVSTVPTRQLVTDSFQNWRGMREQGVRRIKRSFFVIYTGVKKATPEMHEKFGTHHETNLGCFREYFMNYLKKREDVSSEKPIMVRLLPASEYGIPVEIYCFVKNIIWTEFEAIQAEIIEHIFIALPKFDLEHYQRK